MKSTIMGGFDKRNIVPLDLCQEVLSIDKRVRFVGIYFNEKLFYKMKEGEKKQLSNYEIEHSMRMAVLRSSSRRYLSDKLGDPIYSLTEYKKVKRITIPIENDDLIIVTTDAEADHNRLIDKILAIKEVIKLK